MRWNLPMAALAIAGLMGVCEIQTARGQQSSSGMFGSRTMGSSQSPGQSSAFGGGSSGGLGSMGGQSGFGGGSSGFGSQMGGQSGMGQGATTGVGGQARRAGDFIGATTQQLNGQGFVGMDQATGAVGMGQGGRQQLSGGRMTGMNSLGGGQFRNTQQAGGMNRGGMVGAAGRSNTASIRTTLSVGFDQSSRDSRRVSSALASRLAGLPGLHWQTPSQVEIQGRTAILGGAVATQHDRDLAERVVRLEAAVDRVENRIVVAANSPAAPAIAPADANSLPDDPPTP